MKYFLLFFVLIFTFPVFGQYKIKKVSYRKKKIKFSFPKGRPPYEGQLFRAMAGKGKSCEVLVISIKRRYAIGDISDCPHFKKIKRKQKLFLQEERMVMEDESYSKTKSDITHNFAFGHYVFTWYNSNFDTAVDGLRFGGEYLFIEKIRAHGSYQMILVDPGGSIINVGGDYVHHLQKDFALRAGIGFRMASTGSVSVTTNPITIGGVYRFTKMWQGLAEYEIDDNVNTINLGLDLFYTRKFGITGRAAFISASGGSGNSLVIGVTYYNW